MRTPRLIAAALITTASLWAAPALAWNCAGHMVVAAVAWPQISTASKARLKTLLELNPEAAGWKAQAGNLDPVQAMFIRAACWADDIKDDPAYRDPDVKIGVFDEPNRNTGYDDTWRHRYWHFKDIPFSPDHTPLSPAKPPTAEDEIQKFRAVLKSNAKDDLKSYDLVWLIHLVGDVHQPLHATSRFVAIDKNGDGGGNDVCLETKVNGRCYNLHSYWDGLLKIAAVTPSAANAYALAPPPSALPRPSKAAIAQPLASWFIESERLAETTAYQPPILGGLGVYDLHSNTTAVTAYHDRALAVARDQAALAGARLAKLINENLV